MTDRIQLAIADSGHLPEVQEKLLALFQILKHEEKMAKLGYVAGIINSDGPEHIIPNRKRLAEYTHQIRIEQPFPVFSVTDIFTDEVRSKLPEERLPFGEKEMHYVRFWRAILQSGHVTDLFMTPRWEQSKGARDEYHHARETGITIHYVDHEPIILPQTSVANSYQEL